MPTNNTLYYVRSPEQETNQGPYTLDQLRDYFISKQLPPFFLISSDKNLWFTAEEIFSSKNPQKYFEAILDKPRSGLKDDGLFSNSALEMLSMNSGEESVSESSLQTIKINEDSADESVSSLFAKETDDPLGESSSLPNIFGEYKILGEIGRGSMGVVYKVEELSNKKIFALKVIISENYSESQRKRFVREAKLAGKLKHPNIIEVVASGEVPAPYIVMEYVEGETLSSYLRRVGKINFNDAVELLFPIVKAVYYAHENNVVHRDLKPGNIILEKNHVPKVMDFGLAKDLGLGERFSSLSIKGQIIGTPQYMSPEQAAAKGEVDHRTDIYSLGIIFYQMLTGTIPFESERDIVDLLFAVVRSKITPISKKCKDIPKDIELICMKCLEKKPDDRYSNAKNLASDLNNYMKNRPISISVIDYKELARDWIDRNSFVLMIVGIVSWFLMAICILVLLSRLNNTEKELSKVKQELQQIKKQE